LVILITAPPDAPVRPACPNLEQPGRPGKWLIDVRTFFVTSEAHSGGLAGHFYCFAAD
jgi:hypothetical protein